ncbi:MAG TPA: sialidase family protein [Blastocatellia bacterium]|nr:sialidase family protein [Blastocatellia bacterium]
MKKYVSIIGSLIQAFSMSLALAGCVTAPSVEPTTTSGQASQQTPTAKNGPMPAPYSAEIESPAGPESFLPNLAPAPDGRALLSWVEPAGAGGHKLLCAIRQGNAWTAASTIYTYKSGELLFTEPTAPTVLALEDGSLVAQWLVKIKAALDPYARNIYVSRSRDGGKSWSSPIIPHRGGKMSDHSFVSMTPMGKGGVALYWLDGRKMEYTPPENYDGPTVLMSATIGPNDELGEEVEIDGDVCSCCPTSGAFTAQGPIVAYRDHRQEIRDISFARFLNNRWSEPQTLHDDRWEINGCPVNGPVFSADGNRVAVVWFTAAKDAPQVKISFSGNAGDKFGAPIRVDEGSPAGRADVAIIGEDAALVSWVEQSKERRRILTRVVGADGQRSQASIVWTSESGKSTGFPHLAKRGDEWLLAWMDATGPKRVRTAAIKMTGP